MTFNEVFLFIFKTAFCYFFLFGVFKLMGKREVGEISTFDMVCFLVMSELFSISLNSVETPLYHSIIPVLVIVVLQIVSAYGSLKSKKIRKIMEGEPSYLIIDGKINQEELKKNRYNIEDLMMQLRQKDIQTIDECAFALLEGNGNLNILKKDNQKVKYPELLISEGKVNKKALNYLSLSMEEIYIEMAKQGYSDLKEVFICQVLSDNSFLFVGDKRFCKKENVETNIDKA